MSFSIETCFKYLALLLIECLKNFDHNQRLSLTLFRNAHFRTSKAYVILSEFGNLMIA